MSVSPGMNVSSNRDEWTHRGRLYDMDWTSSFQIISSNPRNRKFTAWQCGNRQKLKEIVAKFVENSSMHGVQYISSRGYTISTITRLFFRIFFLLCLLAMMASVVSLIQVSFTTQAVYISTTSKDADNGPDEDPLFPEHPRIVICRKPGYIFDANSSNQDLLEYAFLALGYPFSPLTPAQRSLMVEIASRFAKGAPLTEEMQFILAYLNHLKQRYDSLKESTKNFSLTQYIIDHSVRCQDVFIRCIAFVYDLDCCQIFKPTLTSLGVCYSLVVSGGLLDYKKQVRDLPFSMIFELYAAPEVGKGIDIGYEVHILDPRDEDIPLYEAGYSLMNGFSTVMDSKLIKTSRTALFTPWHGAYTSCPTLPADLDPKSFGERYNKHACNRKYLDRIVQNECGCRYVTDQDNLSIRPCDPIDICGCFLSFAITDNLTGLGEVCVHPCEEYDYDVNVNYFKIGDNNVSRLVLLYDVKQYTLNEYRTATISGFLSQIGGSLGLYLGASIITTVELIIFLASWIYYRLLPNRRISISNRGTDRTRPFLHRRSIGDEMHLY